MVDDIACARVQSKLTLCMSASLASCGRIYASHWQRKMKAPLDVRKQKFLDRKDDAKLIAYKNTARRKFVTNVEFS